MLGMHLSRQDFNSSHLHTCSCVLKGGPPEAQLAPVATAVGSNCAAMAPARLAAEASVPLPATNTTTAATSPAIFASLHLP